MATLRETRKQTLRGPEIQTPANFNLAELQTALNTIRDRFLLIEQAVTTLRQQVANLGSSTDVQSLVQQLGNLATEVNQLEADLGDIAEPDPGVDFHTGHLLAQFQVLASRVDALEQEPAPVTMQMFQQLAARLDALEQETTP